MSIHKNAECGVWGLLRADGDFRTDRSVQGFSVRAQGLNRKRGQGMLALSSILRLLVSV